MPLLTITPSRSAVSPRLLVAGIVALSAISTVRPAIVSPVSPSACVVDGPTGLPIPEGVRGGCVAALAGGTVLVQRAEDGLLIAELAGPASSTDKALDVRGALDVRQSNARILFCPSNLLDAASGAPTPACVATGNPLQPGPGALVGEGSVRANLHVDRVGRMLCPSATRIAAAVTSPDGARFDLTGSMTMLGEPGRTGSCATAYDRIELELGSTADASASQTIRAPDQTVGARRLEQVMQLDDEQWRTVELLLALTPRDWQVFDAIVRQDAGSAGLPRLKLPTAQPEVQGLADVVNTILGRVNAIRANLDSLSGRIPDRSDVRDLLSQIDLDHLRELLGNVRDTLQGLVDIARDLREGYDSFDVARFRTRLEGVFDDVESASSLYQRTLCIDDPDLQIRQISTAPLKRLIDRAPGVTLYALSKIMEAIDSDWDQRIGAVVDAVPSEITEFCNEGRLSLPALSVDAANIKCKVLRRKVVGTGLAVAKVRLAVPLMVFRYIKNHTEEEIAATVGASAVAGGAAGSKVKNPAYEAIAQWIDRLENIKNALSDVADQRKDCLDADKDIENDLKDCAKDGCNCTVPLSVLLQGKVSPTYVYVADLVDARIAQAEDAGLPGTDGARLKHDEAVDTTHDQTAVGYGLLCDAYRLLLPSSRTLRFEIVPDSAVVEAVQAEESAQ